VGSGASFGASNPPRRHARARSGHPGQRVGRVGAPCRSLTIFLLSATTFPLPVAEGASRGVDMRAGGAVAGGVRKLFRRPKVRGSGSYQHGSQRGPLWGSCVPAAPTAQQDQGLPHSGGYKAKSTGVHEQQASNTARGTPRERRSPVSAKLVWLNTNTQSQAAAGGVNLPASRAPSKGQCVRWSQGRTARLNTLPPAGFRRSMNHGCRSTRSSEERRNHAADKEMPRLRRAVASAPSSTRHRRLRAWAKRYPPDGPLCGGRSRPVGVHPSVPVPSRRSLEDHAGDVSLSGWVNPRW
jgi:hypothetical protein